MKSRKKHCDLTLHRSLAGGLRAQDFHEIGHNTEKALEWTPMAVSGTSLSIGRVVLLLQSGNGIYPSVSRFPKAGSCGLEGKIVQFPGSRNSQERYLEFSQAPTAPSRHSGASLNPETTRTRDPLPNQQGNSTASRESNMLMACLCAEERIAVGRRRSVLPWWSARAHSLSR